MERLMKSGTDRTKYARCTKIDGEVGVMTSGLKELKFLQVRITMDGS